MNRETSFDAGNIRHAIADAVARFADRAAVSRGDETWSYARLGAEISQAADLLREAPGPILYSPSNSPQALALLYGAVAADKVLVLPDPTWTDVERAEVVRRCAIASVVTEAEGTTPWLREVARAGAVILSETTEDAGERDLVRPRPDTAFCRFSSGTTGFARCLEFSHHAVLSAARSWWRAARYGGDDRVLCLATLNNGLAFNTCLLPALLAGAHLTFHSGPLIPSALAATTRRSRPSVLVAFPFVYDTLVGARQHLALEGLRLAVSSAAPLRSAASRAFEETYGVTISDYYGLVEAGPCTFNDGRTAGSVGRALDDVSFKLRAEPAEDGAAAAAGEGRLCVRSRAMASGYLDQRGPAFAESLDEEGYYVTSDLATIDEDGRLFLRGRIGRLINLEGRKIDPVEVESLLRGARGVTDVLVRAEPAPGRTLVAAYVEGTEVDRELLAQLVNTHLAPYKRPQRICLLARFPRSAAGKILLSQLPTSGEVSPL